MDSYDENFCQRQGKACCAFCFGLILVPITMGFVFWNENDEVVNYATAEIVTGATMVPGCQATPASNGKLVFAACSVNAPELASNRLPSPLDTFLPSYKGSSLQWSTEVFQWIETSSEHCTKDNHGGKHCTTTYSCDLGWSSSVVDSSSFKCSSRPSNQGHGFPQGFQTSNTIQAEAYSVKLMPDLALDQNLQQQLPQEDLASVMGSGPGHTSTYGRSGGQLSASMLVLSGGYLQTSPSSPQVGDIRISLAGRSSKEATVASMQTTQPGNTPQMALGPWPSQKFGWFGKTTKPLEKLFPGLLSVDEFVSKWNSEIAAQAWAIRFGTFIVMVIAFEMIVQPLSVSMDLLRMLNWCTCCLGSLLDNLAQCVIHTIAFCCAAILWLFTFAIAWIVARPLLGICILILDIAGIAACIYFARKRKAREGGEFLIPPAVGPPSQMQFPQTGGTSVAPQPVQATPAQVTLMNVTCPAGIGPGGLLSITTPSGQQVSVTVPANVYQGQQFQVQVPA